MIDLHSHVLHGIDDGPGTIEGSLGIVRAAAADGVARLAATPHVRHDHPTRPEQMEQGVEALNALDVGVEILRGGELDLEYAARLDDDTLRRFGLGGNPTLLLLEFPYVGWPLQLRDRLFDYAVRGYTVLLAHPERNADVQVDPERLRPLVEAGVYIQVTAASLDGRLGRRAASCGRSLVASGLAHVIASDAHESSIREIGLRTAVESVGDEQLAEWLTSVVPAALLTGEAPPPRPRSKPRRFLRRN